MGRNSVVLHTPTFEMRLSGNIDERNHEKLCNCYKGKLSEYSYTLKNDTLRILRTIFQLDGKMHYFSIKTT